MKTLFLPTQPWWKKKVPIITLDLITLFQAGLRKP
jgi:hypothetical protein